MDKNYIPKWKLEWYLMGALPAEEHKAVAALEASSGELRGRIDALRAINAEMLAKYPPKEMARKAVAAVDSSVNTRALAPARNSFWSWEGGGIPRWTIPAFACATLFLAISVQIFVINKTNKSDGDMVLAYADSENYENRTKGSDYIEITGPSLEVWRKVGQAVEKLAHETQASAGDDVQLRYIVPDSCYGALVSIDGLGVMTVHLSDNNGKSVQLTPGRPVALNTSYKLDDAPEYEAFYLITSSDSFAVDSIKGLLARKEHPLDNMLLPQERQVTVFTLKKSDGGGIN